MTTVAASADPDSPVTLPPETKYPRVTAGGVLSNLTLSLIGIAFLLPLLWLLFASFDAHAGWDTKLPSFTLKNYSSLLNSADLRPFLNSLYLAVLATIVTTVFALFAAYPLSRRWFPLKRSVLLSILFASGLPILIVLVPTYQMFVQLGWINSLFWTGLFLAASSLPFAIWLMKNFIDAVPRELEEAAQMEGAGTFRLITRIVVPLTVPGLAVTSMITFISAWGAFVIPLILNINPSDTPGAVAVYQFESASYGVKIGPLAAYSVLFSLPVIAMYMAIAKQLRGAFTFGGGIRG